MLEGMSVAITGAGAGIGRAIAIGLGEVGAQVVVNDYGVEVDGSSPSDEPANEVVRIIRDAGGTAVPCTSDVGTMHGGVEAVQTAIDEFGRIDGLIALAGIMRPASIFDMTEDEWDDVLRTNLKGHFSTVQAAARSMRDQRAGRIVTFTSAGGIEGSPAQPNYAASKAGIVGLTRTVALALLPYGATCNSVAPAVRTRMVTRLRPERDPGGPEVVVNLVKFLLSDAGVGVTGQVIRAIGHQVGLYAQPVPVRTLTGVDVMSDEEFARTWSTSLGSERLVRYDRFVDEQSPDNPVNE